MPSALRLAVAGAVMLAASRAGAADPPGPEKPAEPPPAAPSPPATATEAPSPEVERGELTRDSEEIRTTREKAEAETELHWRNSTFHFEQSVSTQTAGLETSPQLTFLPVYEWWLSFRPRWYFDDHVSLRFRFDYYKEFTNSAQTAYYREDVFGDSWADLAYEDDVRALSKHTHGVAGIRLRFPTSKVSQDEGLYVDTGLFGGLFQDIPIRGFSARYVPRMQVRVNAWYDHYWSRATTGTNSDLDVPREDIEGQSFISDQLSGVPLDEHRLVVGAGASLWIMPRIHLDADAFFINHWHYAATSNVCVATLTGCAEVTTTPGFGTTYTVDAWLLGSLEYDFVDEFSLAVGYYNLANEIAPDGQRRGLVGTDNIWWSPSARVFLDLTANLDVIYEWFTGRGAAPPGDERARAALTTSGHGGLGL